MIVPEYPEKAILSVENAQRVRNAHLGEIYCSDQDLAKENTELRRLLQRPQTLHFVVHPAARHDLVNLALPFTYGWFSGGLLFREPDKSPLRSQVAKVVLFREFVSRYGAAQDYSSIMDAICPLDPLRAYAESECLELDLANRHFFLHSSLSARLLSGNDYASIDREQAATILYPMYEAELIGTLVSLLKSLLSIYDRFRQRRSHSDRDDELTIEHQSVALTEKELLRARQFIESLVIEMSIREKCLLDLITGVQGRISREKLMGLYFDKYLPAISSFRNRARETDLASLGISAGDIVQIVDSLAPRLCNVETKREGRCRRVVPGGKESCWQHGGGRQE